MKDIIKAHREGISYVFWGAFTTLVTLLSYMLFVRALHVDPNFSNILSWVCGVLFAFVVNKWFVFQSRSMTVRIVMRELGYFFSSRIFTGIVAFILFPILNDWMGLGAFESGIDFGILSMVFGTSGMLAKIITSLVEIVLNWILSKYVVFKKDPADAQ